MATFHLLNFGCRASQADGAALKAQLLQAGLEEAPGAESSDLAVLNTCTVTAAAEARGHYDTSRLGKPPAGAETRVLVGAVSDEFLFVPVSAPPAADDRTRPTLKVQDGCGARCSFCVIPYVRGASRSLAPDLVIRQVLDLERQGYKEIVLSGINLGSYGRDLDPPSKKKVAFLGLLERVLAETTIARLRISSIEPMDVTPELIRLAASEPRLARHFHVPLQSGCVRILRLMNPRYWT